MSRKSEDMIDWMWGKLQGQIIDVNKQLTLVISRTERAEVAGGHQAYTFATMPTVNNSGGDEIWVSNGRKVGEGAGAGTGVLCYWNPTTGTWKKHRDDTDVTA